MLTTFADAVLQNCQSRIQAEDEDMSHFIPEQDSRNQISILAKVFGTVCVAMARMELLLSCCTVPFIMNLELDGTSVLYQIPPNYFWYSSDASATLLMSEQLLHDFCPQIPARGSVKSLLSLILNTGLGKLILTTIS